MKLALTWCQSTRHELCSVYDLPRHGKQCYANKATLHRMEAM